MEPSFDEVLLGAIESGFTFCSDEWREFRSRPTCSYLARTEGRHSWSMFLRNPVTRIRVHNKVRLLRNCFTVISFNSAENRYGAIVFSNDKFHPHRYASGKICMSENSSRFDEFVRLNVYLAFALVTKSLSQISTSGIVSVTKEMSYVCVMCKSRRRVNYRTYLPIKHPYRDAYVCPSCFKTIS
jgi:hypothetical protein